MIKTYLEKLKDRWGDLYNLDEIPSNIKAKDYIYPICKIHGQFKIRADQFAFGQGCQSCSKEKQYVKTNLSERIFRRNLTNNYGYGSITKDNFFKIAAIKIRITF